MCVLITSLYVLSTEEACVFSSSAVYIIDTRDRVYIWSGKGASNWHKSVAEVTLKALQVCIYIHAYTYIYIHIYTDRQTDRKTDRQTDRQMYEAAPLLVECCLI